MKYLLPLLLFTSGLAAQKKSGWDTTRYQKFKTNLMVGIFQSHRNFNNEFRTFRNIDTGRASNNYMSESKLITGIEISYDKFSLSLGLKSEPQKNSQGKGNTQTFNVNLNVGGNIWFLENSLRSFKGFYDANTPVWDTTFKESGNYYYQPNFTNFLFRSKFLYFTNHKKYAYRANYVCNYRQLKTSASWILGASTNYNYMHNDSSFFPAIARPGYKDYGTLNGLRVFGVAANCGGAFTLVLWRAFFVHLMLVVGPEQQWRNYEYLDKPTKDLSYLSFSGCFSSSIGLNFKRVYLLITSQTDYVSYDSSFMYYRNRAITSSFMLGYRFNSRTPGFYKKIQETRIYGAL